MDIAALSPFAASLYREDRDRFYLAMLAAQDRRADLLALLALNLDLSKLRSLTRGDDRAGLIRLQWWQEVIAGERPQEAAGHPLARAMLSVIHHHTLPVTLLSAMIAARAADLYPAPFATMIERDDYVDQTAGILAELGGRILGATGEDECRACRIAGQKFGSIGLLRAVPYHGAEGWVSIPADKLAEKGLDAEAVRDGRADLSAVVSVIRDMLDEEDERIAPSIPVSAAVMPMALHGLMGRCYGQLLCRYDGNPFTLPADLRPVALPLKLWWGQVRGRWQ